MTARRNIEFKARLVDFAGARQIAQELAKSRMGVEQQTDTYFVVPRGRLKLREIAGGGAWLIAYERADSPELRNSDYRLIAVSDPAELKAALAETLGVRVIVDKRREIFLHHNVRIHLDQVAGLGEFLEFEAVLGPGDSDSSGHAQVAGLRDAFQSALGEPMATSYSHLLLGKLLVDARRGAGYAPTGDARVDPLAR